MKSNTSLLLIAINLERKNIYQLCCAITSVTNSRSTFSLLTGIPERIEYTPGSGSRVLVPDAELQLCDVPCDTENVSVRLSLATHHIGKGCDRDTYSVESQRKLCGQ